MAAKVSIVAFRAREPCTSRPDGIVPCRQGLSMGWDAGGSCTVLVPFSGLVPRLYRDNLLQNAPVCDGLLLSRFVRNMVLRKNILAFRRGSLLRSPKPKVTGSNPVGDTL